MHLESLNNVWVILALIVLSLIILFWRKKSQPSEPFRRQAPTKEDKKYLEGVKEELNDKLRKGKL